MKRKAYFFLIVSAMFFGILSSVEQDYVANEPISVESISIEIKHLGEDGWGVTTYQRILKFQFKKSIAHFYTFVSFRNSHLYSPTFLGSMSQNIQNRILSFLYLFQVF